jgi:hypothetical protein
MQRAGQSSGYDEQSGQSTKSTLREQLHPPKLIGVGGLIMHGNRSLQRHVESNRVVVGASRKNVSTVRYGWRLSLECVSGALQVGPRDGMSQWGSKLARPQETKLEETQGKNRRGDQSEI